MKKETEPKIDKPITIEEEMKTLLGDMQKGAVKAKEEIETAGKEQAAANRASMDAAIEESGKKLKDLSAKLEEKFGPKIDWSIEESLQSETSQKSAEKTPAEEVPVAVATEEEPEEDLSKKSDEEIFIEYRNLWKRLKKLGQASPERIKMQKEFDLLHSETMNRASNFIEEIFGEIRENLKLNRNYLYKGDNEKLKNFRNKNDENAFWLFDHLKGVMTDYLRAKYDSVAEKKLYQQETIKKLDEFKNVLVEYGAKEEEVSEKVKEFKEKFLEIKEETPLPVEKIRKIATKEDLEKKLEKIDREYDEKIRANDEEIARKKEELEKLKEELEKLKELAKFFPEKKTEKPKKTEIKSETLKMDENGLLLNWQNRCKRYKIISEGGTEGMGLTKTTFVENESGDYIIDTTGQCYPLKGNKFKTSGNEVYSVVSEGKDWRFEQIATCEKINGGWRLKEQGRIIRPPLKW